MCTYHHVVVIKKIYLTLLFMSSGYMIWLFFRRRATASRSSCERWNSIAWSKVGRLSVDAEAWNVSRLGGQSLKHHKQIKRKMKDRF